MYVLINISDKYLFVVRDVGGNVTNPKTRGDVHIKHVDLDKLGLPDRLNFA